MKAFFYLPLVIAVMTVRAVAAPDPVAFEAFVRGDYDVAAAQSATTGKAEDLLLAARALNAINYFDLDRKAVRARADRALELSERAIAADPALAHARLQAGVSLSLKASRMAPVRAIVSGLPVRSRARLDEALALAPDDPSILATSAAWRIEVARRGGGALKGADPERGFEEFERARAAAPLDPLIAHECALRLLADGRKEWRSAALSCLNAALAAPASLKFERDMQVLSSALKAAVDEGPKAEKAFIARQP